MRDIELTVRERTTEERMQAILQARAMYLRAQKELDKLSSRLAPDKAALDLKIADLRTEYEMEHANDLIQQSALEKAIEVSEATIRESVVEEYESRDAEAKKDKGVAPNLGVQVRETRSISESFDHDVILETVQKNYPTLITFDEKKLIKQSKVYDVTYIPDPHAMRDGLTPIPQIPVIKEMPYIQIEQKVGAVIKTGFWEEGELQLENEALREHQNESTN